ncbi:hypothetical protein CLV51_11252 [Chitinophaga niastensis]|uniref:Uncharacterized protein n=2 Tax=Chitinophaga niastensis TaxID=536980 RepID=A0A2P8H8J2_CHINA|nr:hypothetical protein CLV51_11252 [Chitinophaga niastensis]
MGAEAEFDRGLRPEKHPKYLFDKKTMKDMERNGNVSTYTPKRHNTARTIPLPQKAGDSTATRKDSIHVIVDSAKATVLPPDSTHIPQ